MNHKRKRPKSSRAGCLMCKPWKRQGSKLTGWQGRKRLAEQRADVSAKEQRDAPVG